MRPWLANLSLLAAALVVAAGVGEVALRARFGPPVYWRFPQERYVPDDAIGYWLAAGQRSYTHDAPVSVNSDGLRDRAFAPATPPNTTRVLALGDSQTFGNGLENADTWPKQLERLLDDAASGGRWQVVNAGLAGSNTWQHERMLVRLHDAYRPDVAVLGFYVNDVLERPDDPTAVAQGDRETNTLAKRIGYVLKRSALFTALWQSRFALAAWVSGDAGPDWETRVLTGAGTPEIEAGWRQVERSLASMAAFAAAHDVRLLVLVIPRRDQVAGDQPATAYQQRLAAITARLGIERVDPLPELRAAFEEHGSTLFIPWDGHNGALANAVLARAVRDRLAMLSPRER